MRAHRSICDGKIGKWNVHSEPCAESINRSRYVTEQSQLISIENHKGHTTLMTEQNMSVSSCEGLYICRFFAADALVDDDGGTSARKS